MVDVLNTSLLLDGELDDSGFGDDVFEIDDEDGYDVTFETDLGVLEPVYVQKYGGESFGQHTTLHDDCGNSSTVNGGATGFQITVEGIMTLEQLRNAREYELHEGTEVSIALQPWVETYICDDFSWDKPSDLNKWYSPEYPDGAEAFTFQLMTKDPTQGNTSSN